MFWSLINSWSFAYAGVGVYCQNLSKPNENLISEWVSFYIPGHSSYIYTLQLALRYLLGEKASYRESGVHTCV